MSKHEQTSALEFDETLVSLGKAEGAAASPKLATSPLLQALRRAGTSHIYADTASVQELGDLIAVGESAILGEVDGNTANQPLVHKVMARYLEGGPSPGWATELRSRLGIQAPAELLPWLYAIVCGRIGNDAVQAYAVGRPWEVSLQLHMGLGPDPARARRIGHYIRQMVPSAFVKVPFTPEHPHCFLLARDLERDGIPVNFTSTFSARQAVAAALLANVERTNIFMGRIDQGLKAELLGAHIDLETQRALTRLRREAGVKTQLIVASLRKWQTFVDTAGCDVYTSPCSVLREFLNQKNVSPEQLSSRLDTSYADRLGMAKDVVDKLGQDRIARLYQVEPTFVEFLTEYRATKEYGSLSDGERLVRRFEEAGFGDFFYAPNNAEWEEMRRSKLPDLDGKLITKLALDTHYTLLADADFGKYQDDMDREITRHLQA